MTDDEIMDRWRELVAKVEAAADKAVADPALAALDGIVPIHDTGSALQGFGRRGNMPAPINERAGWLRGAARKIEPKAYRWEVQEMVGGNAALILLAYEPNADDPLGGLT